MEWKDHRVYMLLKKKKDVAPTASYKVGTLCVRQRFSAKFNTSTPKKQVEKFLYLDIFAVRRSCKAKTTEERKERNQEIEKGRKKQVNKKEKSPSWIYAIFVISQRPGGSWEITSSLVKNESQKKKKKHIGEIIWNLSMQGDDHCYERRLRTGLTKGMPHWIHIPSQMITVSV